MSETEKLLSEAQDMALRSFDQPSQETVMSLWQRLCEEADRRAWNAANTAQTTLH
ncbi:hypothetical protein [Bordetella sp. 15P40C-2]|uniref:hypothetical protein n=1 Tax=Bordetella sp. 15P40C-2 TaxID=2572246 RepID=UPI001920B87D|nr:hypothetical protein [Bordetella sp. 15P40C-2]